MKKLFVYLIIFLLLTSSVSYTEYVYEEAHVLMISSYSPSFMTFFDQIEGVKSVMTDHITLDIEFMDSKRYYNDENLGNFKESITYKMSQIDYDLIITSDDNALNFVLEHKDTLFLDIPIVFLGVNNLENAALAASDPWITGVVEASSLDKTIDIALELNPDAINIVALTDPTNSGQGDLNRFYSLENSYPNHTFKDIDLSDLSYDDFKNKLNGLNQEDIVILLSVYSDKDNNRISFYDGLEIITENTSQPVYHPYMHGIGKGLMGGKVISHFEQGKTAGQLAMRVLKGEPISDIEYIRSSPNQYVFDHDIMSIYGISINQLPEETLILNYDQPFIIKYWPYVLFATLIIILEAFVIYILIKTLKTKKRYEIELNNSHFQLQESHREVLDLNNKLEKRVLDRTIELESTNAELAITIENLRETQDRLLINKAMESYLELSRKLSHLINTPLGSALTSSTYEAHLISELTKKETLSKNSNFQGIHKSNQLVIDNIQRAISVVDELQSFAVYEPSSRKNISESIRRLVKLIESDIRYTDYKIILDLDESIFIPINEKVFDKILRSIIENAIDFSDTDDLVITIKLSQSDTCNIISVSDNGLGITNLSKEEIFRPFYTTSPHKLGMGLFLSESYVYQTLHGRLTYDEDYQDGAKFDICIPI